MLQPTEIQNQLIERITQAGEAFEQFDCLLGLAAELDELPEQDKRDDVLVSGCQSQVWLYLEWRGSAPGRGFALRADSDTLMVRGVLRIFELMFGGQDARAIAQCPVEFVEKTELSCIFDAQRKAGVAAIAGMIRAFALEALPAEEAAQITGGPGKATLKERLDAAALDADASLQALANDDLDRAAFRAQVRSFTLSKFFLTEGEALAAQTEDILKLANVSVEKLLRQNDKSVKLAEGSTTCTNQSSTDIKKVLLSMTLQRALGVKFTPEQSANCETITQLADALFDARSQ